MLRRLEQIKNCGVFEEYRWSAAVPGFEHINLFFGTNGAGNTTSLARVLDSLNAERGGCINASIRPSNVDETNDRAAAACGGCDPRTVQESALDRSRCAPVLQPQR